MVVLLLWRSAGVGVGRVVRSTGIDGWMKKVVGKSARKKRAGSRTGRDSGLDGEVERGAVLS
jgi:hypothetical protein